MKKHGEEEHHIIPDFLCNIVTKRSNGIITSTEFLQKIIIVLMKIMNR